jgi:hypothetical protein
MVSRGRGSPNIGWLKSLILPAAKSYTSRRLTAGAIVAATISGFRWVQPIDEAARLFRWFCLAGGVVGFIWLVTLLIFPPRS